MINYITDFHNTFNMSIWVTEWACQDFTSANQQCSAAQVKEYMNITQSFMEKTEWYVLVCILAREADAGFTGSRDTHGLARW